MNSLFGKTLTQYMSVALGASAGPAASDPADASSADKQDAGQTETPLSQLLQSLTELLKGNAGQSADGSGANGTGVDELNNILDAISDLLKNGKDLDQALAGDPSLLLQLQNWIQQAMQLLQNGAGNAAAGMTNSGDNQSAAALPLLAQSPQTIGLALQDTVQLLKDQLNLSAAQGKLDSPSFGQLMSQLQNMLQQAVNKPGGQQQQAVQPAAQQQSDQSGNEAANPVSTQDNAGAVQDNASLTKTVTAAAFKEASADQNGSRDDGKGKQDGIGIVTAGQLQLRDGTAAAPIKADPPVPVEKFAQEMSNFVVSKMDIVKLQGMSEAKITLFPENLGQVDVKITLHNGQVVAQFVTEHAFAKDSLEQQMAQLRTALQTQGLQVEKLEVTQNPTLSSHMYQDGKQSAGGGSQQRQNGKRRETNEEEGMGLASIDTIEDWNEWVSALQAKQDEYGSSFTAKA